MDETWDRVEAWLAAHAPEVLASLNPPAGEDEIAATEALVGRALPEDVKAAYRRHDGQADGGGLFAGWDWLPLAGVRDAWAFWAGALAGGDFADERAEADGRTVRAEWWHPGWVPVTHSGSGNHHCLDLAPGSDGTVGQLVTVWHDWERREVVAGGFLLWLGGFAGDLEAGRVVAPAGRPGLVRRADP